MQYRRFIAVFQILYYALPVRELVGTELDMTVAKFRCAMGGAIVDEIGTRLEAEVLVVGEDDSFVERLREELLNPIEFVLHGCGIVPWGCREDIAVVFFCQRVYGINGTRHGFH